MENKYRILSHNDDGSVSIGFFSFGLQSHVTIATVGNPDFFRPGAKPDADTVANAERIVSALNLSR